jgi:hypothetical protein
MAWRVRMAARIARALALSPLAVWGGWAHGDGAGTCRLLPLQEGAWWRGTLLTTDGSGSVEKVMVLLLGRCTVIKSQRVLATPAGSLWVIWLYERTKG